MIMTFSAGGARITGELYEWKRGCADERGAVRVDSSCEMVEVS